MNNRIKRKSGPILANIYIQIYQYVYIQIHTRIKDLWSWLSWKEIESTIQWGLFFCVYFNNIKITYRHWADTKYFLSIEFEETYLRRITKSLTHLHHLISFFFFFWFSSIYSSKQLNDLIHLKLIVDGSKQCFLVNFVVFLLLFIQLFE